MNNIFEFTFRNIKKKFQTVLKLGYNVIRCQDYIAYKTKKCTDKILINRVDIDFSIKKAEILANIFNRLSIPATFFVRLHAKEYNPFSFENYRILKNIKSAGHEIGYHSEVIDQATIWHEEAHHCLVRDIDILSKILDITVLGAASHGGMTGLNNLDFWKVHKPKDFGLLYEAYDCEPEFDLFKHALYVSDSCWTYWKTYDNGVLMSEEKRCFAKHALDGHQILYTLIHPEAYFERHFYE